MQSHISGGRVLVLGDDTRAFLACVRSLGRAGIEVHAACCPSGAAARYSRFLTTCHDLPPFGLPDGPWLPALQHLVETVGFDLVLPVADSTLVPLHTARDYLARPEIYAIPSPAAFEAFFDKAKTTEMARSLGVPTPPESIVHSEAEVCAACADLGMPLFVKPRRSFLPERPAEKFLVHCCKTEAVATETAMRLITLTGSAILQAPTPGHGVGIEVLARDGEILLSFAHLRLHEPKSGGGSSFRMGIPVSPTLLSEVARMCRAVCYTGVAMFEYRIDQATEIHMLLEVNGRFWGSLPLAVTSGADFPRMLFDLLVNGHIGRIPCPRTGLRSRHLVNDFNWWLGLLRGREEGSFPRAVLRETIALLDLHDRIDSLTLDDPRPAFEELRGIAHYFYGRTRDGFVLSHTTRNPESAAARLLAAARRARSVLFLCKGNINRSPFAELTFAKIVAHRVKSASSGHYPESNRPTPTTARHAALAYGINLSDHRSTIVTPEALHFADLVIVFDGENYRAVTARLPEARGKTHLLGVLDGIAEIPDPDGMDEAACGEIFRRIASLVNRLAEVTFES